MFWAELKPQSHFHKCSLTHCQPVLRFKYINTHQSLRSWLTQLFCSCRASTGLLNPRPSRLLFSLCSADLLTGLTGPVGAAALSQNTNFLYHKNIKYRFIFTYFLWHRAFLELQICRQFIANNQCWQGTTSMIKDYTTVHIRADEDRPSVPPKPISVSPTSDFYTFLQSPPETFVADSLWTICCVHMRFAESSLSTAERQGDWSSQSGYKERSPVSEKCKFPAIQQPEMLRDWDGNNSCFIAPTGRDQRGQRG